MNYFKTKTLQPTILVLIGFFIFGQTISIRAQGCVQPAPNMMSWWKGEGDALDIRSRSNGTLQNGVTFAAGYNGRAFSFDGVDDRIALGNPSALTPPFFTNEAGQNGGQIPRSLTIEAWIKKDGVPANGIEDILAKWGFGSTDSYLFGVINDGGTIRAFGAIGDGATGDPGVSGGTIPLDTWTHVAMTYNASISEHKLYVNGAEVASRTRAGLFVSSANVFIGSEDSTNARFFKGLIDEPAFYNRALSGSEIQTIYQARQTGKCKPSGLFSQTLKNVALFNPPNTWFGYSVAVRDDTMLAGMPKWQSPLGFTGGVDFYKKINGAWANQFTIFPSQDGLDHDQFGYSVALTENTIVIGAPLSNAPALDSGAAYVYVRNGESWSFQQKLTASDAGAVDRFGWSVAVSGDTIFIGAPNSRFPEYDGAVYIFNRSGTVWTQSQKLTPTEPSNGDALGSSIAVSGDTLAVGAYLADFSETEGLNSGAVYVYTRSGGTWTQQQKLPVQGTPNSNRAGSSIAIDGSTIVAGAPGHAGSQVDGAAYVFVKNGATWAQQQRLTSSDTTLGDDFGSSVAVSGDTIAAGSPHDDTSAGADGGSVYLFNRSGTTWTEKQKLNSSDGSVDGNFGFSVALSGTKTVVVGAPLEDTLGDNNSGAVYTFNQQQQKLAPFDFDGDSKTDISIFRPSNGQWWYLKSSDGGNYVATFGNSSDKLTPGDFTGDGKADIAFWRPSSGEWFILRSEDASFYAFPFGASGDTPVPADYDGDGKTDAAVFRASTLTWFIQKSSGGTDILTFGAAGDVPTVADYDGDGRSDIAIFRPNGTNGSEWWVRRSSNGSGFALQFGSPTDKLVQGDYTGDGKADIAYWRPSNGNWFILRSEDFSFYGFPFGANGDIPAPGDYDGDGRFDAAVFRPSGATWFVQRSTAGTLIQQFGVNGDLPTQAAFIP